jgi:hypothetical protein
MICCAVAASQHYNCFLLFLTGCYSDVVCCNFQDYLLLLLLVLLLLLLLPAALIRHVLVLIVC